MSKVYVPVATSMVSFVAATCAALDRLPIGEFGNMPVPAAPCETYQIAGTAPIFKTAQMQPGSIRSVPPRGRAVESAERPIDPPSDYARRHDIPQSKERTSHVCGVDKATQTRRKGFRLDKDDLSVRTRINLR